MWTYILQPGETLYILAARFNTRVTALDAANPGIRLKPLTSSQPIHIPGLPTSICNYEVQDGDSLDTIGKKFRTIAAVIQALNPGIIPTDIEVGQIVNVPEILGRD